LVRCQEALGEMPRARDLWWDAKVEWWDAKRLLVRCQEQGIFGEMPRSRSLVRCQEALGEMPRARDFWWDAKVEWWDAKSKGPLVRCQGRDLWWDAKIKAWIKKDFDSRRSQIGGEGLSSRDQVKCWCWEGWVTKDCDSRSWIGGDGLPSRDHVGQAWERSKTASGGFQKIEARVKCNAVWKCPYRFFVCVCGFQWRE